MGNQVTKWEEWGLETRQHGEWECEEWEWECAECKKLRWGCPKWSGDTANQSRIAWEVGLKCR